MDIQPTFPLSRAIILRAVSAVTRVSMDELKSQARFKRIIDARMIYYYLARTLTKASYPQIAHTVNRDHSTAMHGVSKVHGNWERIEPIVRACESRARAIAAGVALS